MKNIYMNKLGLLVVLVLYSGFALAQSEPVPYTKSNDVGWNAVTFNNKKVANWTLTGNGLTVGSSKDAGNSVNRNSQHWAFSPIINLKTVSNFLEFSDTRVGDSGSTFSVLIAPANAGTDVSKYVTVEKWTGTQTNTVKHRLDLSQWNAEGSVRIAFLRENEAGASWAISNLKILGSDVDEVENFRVTEITNNSIKLGWSSFLLTPEVNFLLVGSHDPINFSPSGQIYSVGSEVADGVTVLYNGTTTNFKEVGLGEFTSRFYKIWAYTNELEYSMAGRKTNATTIGESTIFYEDFENLTYKGNDWAKNGIWSSDNNWSVTNNSSADSWLPKGNKTSYRGDCSAYIVDTHSSIIPGYIGNYGGVHTPGLSSDIEIPSNYKSAELAFFWKAGGQQGYDYGRVYINNVAVTAELYGQTNWKQEVVDLSAYIGQTVTLKFVWRNTYAYSGINLPSFAIDDVMITGKSVAKAQDFSATVVNSSLVALNWRKNSDNNRVVVVYSSSGAFGSMNDGQKINEGDQIAGGGEVIYKGDADKFNHSIVAGNKAYYRIWSLSDGEANTYSTALSASTVLPVSLPFFDGFEKSFIWNVIPSINNSWYRGRAKVKDGAYSVYVSKNGGFTTDYDGAWSDKPAILELPINLAGFSSVDVGFDWMLDGNINNTWGEVRLENGTAFSQMNNPAKLAGKRTWQNVKSWLISDEQYFSSGSVLRFYMRINGGNTDLGFVLDNVSIKGILKPVKSLLAANYGGLKNYVNWKNVVDDKSLEAVIIAFTSAPSATNYLQSGEKYSVGDIIEGGRIVYIGGGESYIHEPVLGGEAYIYQIYQKNGLTYSVGKVTSSVTTPENVVFYEDFESNPIWSITGGTGNTWEFGYPSTEGNGSKVAFVTKDSVAPGYAGNKHSESFVVSMVKTVTFPRLKGDVKFSFDYRVETGKTGNNNIIYDNALVTLSGDVVHTTGKLSNNSIWTTYNRLLTLSGTGETATITISIMLEVNTDLTDMLGFLIDNISITGAYDRNSEVTGTQGAGSHNLSSLIIKESETLEPFRFKVTDKSGDARPTFVHQLEVIAGAGNTISDWKAVIGGVNLYKKTLTGFEYITSGVVQSQSIVFGEDDMLIVDEGGVTEYEIRPWLHPSLNSAWDNKTLAFKIASANIIASKGSSFKEIESSALSDKYILCIEATELRFLQEPSYSSNKNTVLPRQPKVIATDANGNIDSDFQGTVLLTSTPAGVGGSFLNPLAVNGNVSYEGISFSESGSYVLSFNAVNLTELKSTEIDISNYEEVNLGGSSFISAVRFAGIDSYTGGRGANGYELLTDQVAYLTTGESYDMQVLFTVAPSDGSLTLKASIDYNDGNGFVLLKDFGSFSNVSNKVEKQAIPTPVGKSGRFRLRLSLNSGINEGEVEDYTVVISEGQWTGLSPAWDVRDNWTSGRIPKFNDDIIIPAIPKIGSFFPIISDVRDVNNVTIERGARMTLKSGSKLTVNGDLTIKKPGGLVIENKLGSNGLASLITKGEVIGKAEVKLQIEGNRWYYLSSAVASPTFGELGANDSPFDFRIDIYRKSQWFSIYPQHSASRLREMEGFSVKNKEATDVKDINLFGNLNSGKIVRTFAESGWHMFGNPYPSAINWASSEAAGLKKENISPTIWYRTQIGTELAFVTYNGATNTASYLPTEVNDSYTKGDDFSIIPPYQSVWIKAANLNGSITLNNGARLHSYSESYSAPQLKSSMVKEVPNKIRILASNQYSRDATVLSFGGDYSVEFGTEDSEKYFNSSERIPEVFTKVGTRSIAINGLPELGYEADFNIPISVRNRDDSPVTLKFNLDEFSSHHSLALVDNETGDSLSITNGFAYTYTPNLVGENHNRFVVHFNSSTEEEDVSTSILDELVGEGSTHINIVGANGRAIVSIDRMLLQEGAGQIEVFNVSGAKINEFKANTNKTFIVLPEAAGVYLVVVKAGGKIKSKKLVR